jgi:hypothetical protein
MPLQGYSVCDPASYASYGDKLIANVGKFRKCTGKDSLSAKLAASLSCSHHANVMMHLGQGEGHPMPIRLMITKPLQIRLCCPAMCLHGLTHAYSLL